VTRQLVTLAAGLVAAAAVAGCGGGGGSNGSGPPAGSVVVKLSEFKFDPSTITHAHGSITFFLENTGTAAHDMFIYKSGSTTELAGSELVQPGNDSTFTVNIPDAGSYTFKCTQPGHADAGMTGTLTIT
jgi:uncharacterized cupredoxin-like copper-binding protein